MRPWQVLPLGAPAYYKWQGENAPLNAMYPRYWWRSVYLLSDLSCAVTGETLCVDCVYNIVGMAATAW